MKKILKVVAALAMVVLFNSCGHDDVDGLPTVDFTDISYIINESSHQICMSDIDSFVYPESITLASADSAVDDSNVWSVTYSYWDEIHALRIPATMTITIDGSFSYTVYQNSGVDACKCSGSCVCGAIGESYYYCMCSANIINPCKYKNWVWVSINGFPPDEVENYFDGENVCIHTFTITEEMVEETLRLLAEDN